jgi:hypothetical protein
VIIGVETDMSNQKEGREGGVSRVRKHRKGKDDLQEYTKQRPVEETITKTKGIFLGIAAAAFIWTQRQRGRPRQKVSGPGKANRPRKGKHHHRIGKK